MRITIRAGIVYAIVGHVCASSAVAIGGNPHLVGIRHDMTPSQLLSIDVATAASMQIGSLLSTPITGLAFDHAAGILYGIHPFEARLYTIDTQTAQATPIGSPGALGFVNGNALAWDPTNKVLYSADINTNSLFSINPRTGGGSFVAMITGGFSDIEGMAFDPFSGTLYGLADNENQLVTIDVSSGIASGGITKTCV